ncbi:MAG: threonylcarbamoyl-AMP synthase [Blastocatellia bacterium]|nr:threonylcarbamoyl-AMP synthase [Blastocatellia bacterium]
MQTRVTDSIVEAAEFINSGEIVAFPTETVYGLGADLFNQEAVGKIFIAKGRPSDNPLIAHISDLAQLEQLVEKVPSNAKKLIEKFFPGALTLVLPKSSRVPAIVTAGLDTVAVRMPKHKLAQAFIKECRTPLVAPSANLSGRPSPTTWQAVLKDMNGLIACLLKGERTEFGLESTVVDCSRERACLLRAGGIGLEDLRSVLPDIVVGSNEDGEPVRSPGMKYKHYSPKAEVIIVDSWTKISPSDSKKRAFIGFEKIPENFLLSCICKDVDEYARELFLFFRDCDDAAIDEIYCQKVEQKGIGLALMDRLRRAAH